MEMLVCQGAIATERCYSMVWDMDEWGPPDMNFMPVLVLSGYMLLKFRGSFILDKLFEDYESFDGPSMIDGVLEILPGKVKAEDTTEKVVAHFENLPTLEEGATHKARGDFAKYLKEYLEAET